jgi:hypothetical protein
MIGSPAAGAERSIARTGLGTVLVEEARLILRRHWWEFAGVFLLLTAYFCWPRLTMFYPGDVNVGVRLSRPWGFLLATGMVYLVLGGYLGIALWRDQPRGGREHLARVPVDPEVTSMLRVAVGAIAVAVTALLVFYVTLLVWTLGVPHLERGTFTFGFLPPTEWLSWVVAMVNIYVAGSMVAILSRHPLRTALYVVMGTVLVIAIYVFSPWDALRFPLSAVIPPEGLLGGLGFSVWGGAGELLDPATTAPLLWLPVLLMAVYLAARRAARE